MNEQIELVSGVAVPPRPAGYRELAELTKLYQLTPVTVLQMVAEIYNEEADRLHETWQLTDMAPVLGFQYLQALRRFRGLARLARSGAELMEDQLPGLLPKTFPGAGISPAGLDITDSQ